MLLITDRRSVPSLIFRLCCLRPNYELLKKLQKASVDLCLCLGKGIPILLIVNVKKTVSFNAMVGLDDCIFSFWEGDLHPMLGVVGVMA